MPQCCARVDEPGGGAHRCTEEAVDGLCCAAHKAELLARLPLVVPDRFELFENAILKVGVDVNFDFDGFVTLESDERFSDHLTVDQAEHLANTILLAAAMVRLHQEKR